MAVSLNQIVPWGRTREEYERMFSLGFEDFADGVLDCGGGPSSFAAELFASGARVISVDPLYEHGGAEIRQRFEAVVEPMRAQIVATPHDWTWSFHQDVDDLCAHRRTAIERFLSDYEAGRQTGRYVTGELPALPFASGSFGLAVCSHLLFLYSELLSEAFHIQSALELCRVAREVRYFPLLTLARKPSPHLKAVRAAVETAGWDSEIVTVDYEFQRGGNQMLRVFRPG